MRHSRHISYTLVVCLAVACLLAGAALAATGRDDATSSALVAPSAAKSTPAVRLKASATSITSGRAVTFTITTATKHSRPVRLQHWNAAKRTWRTVASRTAKRTAKVKTVPATGSQRYRAYAPKVTHSQGGKKHRHAAATSATVIVVVKKPASSSGPATLNADEKVLYGAVHEARLQFARSNVSTADVGPEQCLTTYARQHSAWMATQGRAIDPAKSGRTQPTTACPGRTVRAMTRVIGSADSTAAAVDTAITSLLRSPYGETERLLSTCDTATSYTFGIGITTTKGARWISVLVGSPTSATTASGAC